MTSVTFSEYSAMQEARQNIALAVLGYTYELCQALRQDYINYGIKSILRLDGSDYNKARLDDLRAGNCGSVDFIVETGRKYHKIIHIDGGGSRSVHAFVDKKTGELYKSASFKAPAKGVRFDLRIIRDRKFVLKNCDWAGGYLYRNASYTG